MKTRILGGLAIGIALLAGCAQGPEEENAPSYPSAAAPTPLVPQVYAAPPAVAASTASPPAPAMSSPSPMTVPVALRSSEGSAALSSTMILHPYHPYWVIAVH
jgi:hypothetical protein